MFFSKQKHQLSIPEIDQKVPKNLATATFAMGWFWGPDAQFGLTKGVYRTRVGYAGGSKEAPTYRSMGDHTETTQIDYDPQTISYQELLDIFWRKHNPQSLRSRQYMSIIFYNSEVERDAAEETKVRESTRRNGQIYTEVLPLKRFYNAETYHQKYYMQLVGPLYKDLRNIYPEVKAFIDSTAAAQINGFVKGLGSLESLNKTIDSFGLSEKGYKKLIEIVETYGR